MEIQKQVSGHCFVQKQIFLFLELKKNQTTKQQQQKQIKQKTKPKTKQKKPQQNPKKQQTSKCIAEL